MLTMSGRHVRAVEASVYLLVKKSQRLLLAPSPPIMLAMRERHHRFLPKERRGPPVSGDASPAGPHHGLAVVDEVRVPPHSVVDRPPRLALAYRGRVEGLGELGHDAVADKNQVEVRRDAGCKIDLAKNGIWQRLLLDPSGSIE